MLLSLCNVMEDGDIQVCYVSDNHIVNSKNQLCLSSIGLEAKM